MTTLAQVGFRAAPYDPAYRYRPDECDGCEAHPPNLDADE